MEIVLFLKATIAYAISLTAGDDGICGYPVKDGYSIVKIVKFLIKSEWSTLYTFLRNLGNASPLHQEKLCREITYYCSMSGFVCGG